VNTWKIWLKMMKMMLMWLIDGEFMVMCFKCCWVYVGDDNSWIGW